MLTVVGNARILLDKYCSPLSSLPDLRIVRENGVVLFELERPRADVQCLSTQLDVGAQTSECDPLSTSLSLNRRNQNLLSKSGNSRPRPLPQSASHQALLPRRLRNSVSISSSLTPA